MPQQEDLSDAFAEVISTLGPKPHIPGTLPESIRYKVKNPDGSISTVRTISIGTDIGEVLIPTVVDNKVLSNEEAIQHYKQTNEHFGIFTTPEDATAYARQLHEKHARLLKEAGQ